MKKLAVGVWGTAHWSLDLIGRAVSGIFITKKFSNENDANSITGGAIVGAILGALLGFAWSGQSQGMIAPAKVVIAGSLGICIGAIFGAVVQTVDDTIDDWLNSLNSK